MSSLYPIKPTLIVVSPLMSDPVLMKPFALFVLLGPSRRGALGRISLDLTSVTKASSKSHSPDKAVMTSAGYLFLFCASRKVSCMRLTVLCGCAHTDETDNKNRDTKTTGNLFNSIIS